MRIIKSVEGLDDMTRIRETELGTREIGSAAQTERSAAADTGRTAAAAERTAAADTARTAAAERTAAADTGRTAAAERTASADTARAAAAAQTERSAGVGGELSEEEMARLLESDDSFLAQIDEFRARAQKLQQMMANRESRAQKLQEIVDEREDKAEELQLILDERQEQVDGISAVVAKQIDALSEQVQARLDAIEKAVSVERADTPKTDTETTEQMKETLGQVSVQIESLKSDLSDKIHTESVKSYRNTQDVLKDLDEKLDQLEDVEVDVRTLHGYSKVIIGLIAANFVGIVIAVLGAIGVF